MTTTIRKTLHLLLDLPVGVVAFTLAFTPLGVSWIPRVERMRARRLLDVDVSDAKPAWRAVAYSVLMLPLGVTTSTIAITGWATGLSALFYPAYAPFTDKTSVSVGSTTIGGPGWQVATSVAGGMLLLLMPLIVRGLARIDTAMLRRFV